jgi:hypothetical protein
MGMKSAASVLFSFYIVGMVGCVPDASPSGNEAEIQRLLEEFPEATQVDDHSISWDGGNVVLVLGDTGEPSMEDHSAKPSSGGGSSNLVNAHGCPSGWYCVYTHRDWNETTNDPGERRLMFSDCTRNDLSNFGFRDQTSSWVNNGSRTLQVKNDLTAQPDPVLWTMAPQSLSAYVGDAANDRADYFQCP